jgi:hypothetical protein
VNLAFQMQGIETAAGLKMLYRQIDETKTGFLSVAAWLRLSNPRRQGNVGKEKGMNINPIMNPNERDWDGINSIMFYPAERVREIFERMKSAKGTEHEAKEYRIFSLRMERLFDHYSLESNTWLEAEDAIRLAAIGEAVENEEFVTSITAERQ